MSVMFFKRLIVVAMAVTTPLAWGWVDNQKVVVDFRDETFTLIGTNGEFSVESRRAPGRIYASGRLVGLTKALSVARISNRTDCEQIVVMGVANQMTNRIAITAGYDGITIAAPETLTICGSFRVDSSVDGDAFAVAADRHPTGLEATIGSAIPANADSVYCRRWDGLLTATGASLNYDPSSRSYGFAARGKVRFSCRTKVLSERWHINYRPINADCELKTPPVGWMTWYAVKFDACDEIVMRNAKSFMSNFRGYTDERPVLWVDWEWYHEKMGSTGGENHDLMTPRQRAYPRGMRAVSDDLKALGFKPALWVAFVSDVRTNALWRAHPEWILGTQPNWSGPIWGNPTAPGFCEEYIPRLVRLYRDEWGFEAFKWDTLPNANWIFTYYRDRLHDPTMNSADVFRKMTLAGRRAFGPNVYLESCAVVSDRDICEAIDVFDAARVGSDIFNWNDFREYGVNRILHFYPLHNTAFWADADNLVLREEFSTLAQARTRATVYGLAGVPITIGDDFLKLDAARINMLKRTMPVVPTYPATLTSGACPSENLDLTVNVARDFGSWQLKAWSNLSTNSIRRVSFSAPGHAVWDFWNDCLLTEGEFTIAPGDTRLVRVTPLAKDAPTLISVSRHLTQGAYELKSYATDEHRAHGIVRCPGGEAVTLTFILPDHRIVRRKVDSPTRADVPFSFSF